MSEAIDRLNWAIDTIRESYNFGLDNVTAGKYRELRAKGVMIDSIEYIEKLEQENKDLREALNWASNGLFDLEIDDVTKRVIKLRKQFNLDGGQNGN